LAWLSSPTTGYQRPHIRIIHAATGEILRNLTFDPTRSYQGTGAPKAPIGPKTKRTEPS